MRNQSNTSWSDSYIADIATFPWAARHEWHGIALEDFPAPQFGLGDEAVRRLERLADLLDLPVAVLRAVVDRRPDGRGAEVGGLLEDVLRESDQKVPVLGSIPVLGNLFRARKTEKVKTNLMIFIRPTILRDAAQTAIETNQKYNMIRDAQLRNQGTDIQLMPGTERTVLPPLEEVDKRFDGSTNDDAEEGGR